jgi:hypothetical protein
MDDAKLISARNAREKSNQITEVCMKFHILTFKEGIQVINSGNLCSTI